MPDQEKFIEVIKENEGIIFKITAVYTNEREDRRDLYQEIVYQLWKSYESFRGESKISTWLFRIALNTSISYLNQAKRKDNMLSLDEKILNIIDEKDTLLEDRYSILNSHIQRLNLIEKGIIILYMEGKSYDEIARITGFTTTNIGTRLARIKQKLKKEINK